MDEQARKEEVDILTAAVKVIRVLIKNLVWVILFPLGGILAGYITSSKEPQVFEANMSIRTMMIAENELYYLLGNYSHEVPGLTDAERSAVRSFHFDVYTKDNSPYAFITCVVTDTTVLKKIQRGIPHQLDREEIVKSYMELSKTTTGKMIAHYKEKIQMTETMLKLEKEIAWIGMPELMNLYVRLSEYELSYNQKSLVKVVSGFKPVDATPSMLSIISKAVSISIALGAVFLLLKQFIIFYIKTSKTIQ